MHGKFDRRSVLKTLGAGAALASLPVRAQDAGLIRAISAYPPGGLTDLYYRPLWQIVSEMLGQKIIIESKAGAWGAIALDYVAKAPPDGRTLMHFYGSMFLTPYLEPTNYDLMSDFTYIVAMGETPYGIAVAANSRYRTLDDLFAAARARPGQLNYAIAGVGTGGHVQFEETLLKRGLKMTAVPYKGVEYIPALMGGHVDIAVGGTSWGPQVAAGQLRVLAYYTRERLPSYPNVPAGPEVGLDVGDPYVLALVGPKGMSAQTVRSIHDVVKRAIDVPAMDKVRAQSGTPKAYMGSAEFAAFAQRTFAAKGELLARLGLATHKPFRR